MFLAINNWFLADFDLKDVVFPQRELLIPRVLLLDKLINRRVYITEFVLREWHHQGRSRFIVSMHRKALLGVEQEWAHAW